MMMNIILKLFLPGIIELLRFCWILDGVSLLIFGLKFFIDTFRSIGCILVELFTGDAIYQTHENREHLAMIEKTIGKIPIPFANKSPTRKYFKNEGTFDWPNIATDEKSREDVSKLKPLKVFKTLFTQRNN
jgi:hypothetical protein